MTLSTFTDLNAFCKTRQLLQSTEIFAQYYLQHFEVVDILVLQLGVELDLLEHHRPGEQHVHELAIDSAGAELLDLGVLGA